MATATVHAADVHFSADRQIARWRPLVQWLLAVPHLVVANTLSTLRGILTVISLVSVVFTKRIPRPLFDAIAMTYRYEWRAFSYALFLHEDYPPFEFMPAADDDGHERHTSLSITYPERRTAVQVVPRHSALRGTHRPCASGGRHHAVGRGGGHHHRRIPRASSHLPGGGLPLLPTCRGVRRTAD